MTPAAARGRVVMLVDNGVHGDSRVQKQARSMAAAGWDVTLLGMSTPTSTETSWKIGDADVQLIEVVHPLGQHPSLHRRSLRRPLAYPPGRVAGMRIAAAKARRVELIHRRARLVADRAAGGSVVPYAVGMLWQGGIRALAKARRLWIRFRARESRVLRAAQNDPKNKINQAYIRFWQVTRGRKAWRRLDPGLWDYEIAFGPVIDRLKPDIIHANDFRMAGVGARAVARARAAGRNTKLLWDAHEFVAGVMPRASNPRWLPAQIAYTDEYARQADAVVTVSPTLAELLRDTHQLPTLPSVVLNAPVAAAPDDQADLPVPDLRADCGIDSDTPLLVYCGSVNPRRGLPIMVDALPDLPGVHVAFVTMRPGGNNGPSEELLAQAETLGVADRVHLLPYVPHWQVAPYLSAADLGVIPLHHQPNHEIALITKFFEFSHGRLPIVVSDVKTMADTVRQTGQGEVFTARDKGEYLTAVRAVLADPKRYRSAYDQPGLLAGWTWEAQADALDEIYRELISR